MRMLHSLLMPVAGAWRRHRVAGVLFDARWLGLSSIFLHSFHYASFTFCLCGQRFVHQPWMYGDCLEVPIYYQFQTTVEATQRPSPLANHQSSVSYMKHSECCFHSHWGKYIKQRSLHDNVLKTWSSMFFITILCYCGVMYTPYLAVLFCVCLPVCFSVFCVSKYNHVTEIELNFSNYLKPYLKSN